jgi:DNA-binding response OmpR family regulator
MRIVHVEDDKLLRDILKRAFQLSNVQIELEQFGSGDEALPYIEQCSAGVDLFILDICLPGSLNGMQVAQKLRDLQFPGHIVLTSAYGSPDPDWLVSLNLEYLPKPWYVRDLLLKLPQYRVATRAGDSPCTERPATDDDAEIIIRGGAVSFSRPSTQAGQDEYSKVFMERDDHTDETVPHRPALFRFD